MDVPVLQTERLLLRAITPDDRFAIFANYSDPEVAGWFFDQPYTRLEQADHIIQEFILKASQGKGLTWAIVLKTSREFVGTSGYENFTANRDGEIGFDLAKTHWGHGYMAEALSAIIPYGFTVLDLFTIEAHTYSSNARARRLLEKLGFTIAAVTGHSHYYTLARENWLHAHP